MKHFLYLFAVALLLNSSCTKTARGVHFHGRLTLKCDPSYPLRNCTIRIHREYDTGSHKGETIGNVTTDNNGYYDLIKDVSQKGSFMDYSYSFSLGNSLGAVNTEPIFSGLAYSYKNERNMEVNLQAETTIAYKIHIKNVSPINAADELTSFYVTQLDYSNNPHRNIISVNNLSGTSIDTTFYQFYFYASFNYTYEYSYKKNGITTTVPAVPLVKPSCTDTVSVDVFY